MGSSAIARRRPSLMDFAIVSWVIAPRLRAAASAKPSRYGREVVALLVEAGVGLGVDVVEDADRLARSAPQASRRAARGRQPVGIGGDLALELVVERARAREQRLDARDRVAAAPALDLVLVAVARRVVGGRVRAHAVGDGLDERRAVAARGRGRAPSASPRGTASTSLPSTRMLGMPKPARAAGDAGTSPARVDRLGDRPLVVLCRRRRPARGRTTAKIIASFTSPWLVAPSPKYAAATWSVPSRWMPIA